MDPTKVSFDTGWYIDMMSSLESIISKVSRSSEKYIPIFFIFVVGLLLVLKGNFYSKLFGFAMIGLATIMCLTTFRGGI